MRWAILSDIHGNYEALEAVLNALSSERIDRNLCLGDIVGYGADPGECIAQIKKLNAITVAGNHDWASIGFFNNSYFNPAAREAVIWTERHIPWEDKDFLKGLQLVYKEGELTLVHGSLHNPEQFDYILDLNSAYYSFQALQTKICFIGHSHVPLAFVRKKQDYNYTFQQRMKIEEDKFYIINAGSVGQPRDGNPHAAYVVYDSQKKQVQIKRVPYNIAKAQRKIVKAGLPKVLAERLALGR